MWPLLYWGKFLLWASVVVQTVKNPLALWETWVGSLGWEDPLEEGMATHSSIPAWRIPWIEEPGGLCSMWLHEWMLKFIKCFFWVCWKVWFFPSHFVNVVYHIDWLIFVEPCLYGGIKSHSILVSATFSEVWGPICWHVVLRIFASVFIQGTNL